MEKEKGLLLSSMRKQKDKKDIREIGAEEAIKIAQKAKSEISKQKQEEEAKIKKDEVMQMVDKRLDALKDENKKFNKLKQDEIIRRQMEEESKISSNIDDDDDLSIDENMFNLDIGDDDMSIEIGDQIQEDTDNTLEIYSENNDLEIENNEDKLEIIKNNEEKLEVIKNNDIEIVKEPLNQEFINPNKQLEIISNKEKTMIVKQELTKQDVSMSNTSIDEDDFKDLLPEANEENDEYMDTGDIDIENEIETMSEEDTNKAFEEMNKNLAKILLSSEADSIDISKFKMGKPISFNNAIDTKKKDISEHVLWNAQRTIAFQEIDGFDMNDLAAEINPNGNVYNQLLHKYTILYNHIRSNKPQSVKAWLKTTRRDDLDHVYGAGYIASFAETNVFASQCDCNMPFITRDKTVYDMMKFENDEAKKKYDRLLQQPDDSPYIIKGKGYPITENYIFEIKYPSIWKEEFEPLLLENKFREKYNNIINILMYIGVIYHIDRENQTYRPIDYASDFKSDKANREMKIFMNKIKKYGTIIKSLNSDQFSKLWECILKELNKGNDKGLKYILPERICPRCGKKLDEVEMSAENLLFTRHQLGQLASISKNS